MLSQLSYTPTARLVLMVKHLQLFANSENSLLTLYCVRTVSKPLSSDLFWKNLKQRKVSLNDRQTKVLNKLFSGFEGKLTRDKWMKLTKASSRTALRDIEELIDIGVIEQEDAGGRSTSYRLKRIVEGEAEKQLEAGGE